MRAHLLVSVITLAPCLSLADPQCVLPLSVSQPSTVTTPESVRASIAGALRPFVQAAEHGPAAPPLTANGTSVPVLDHVVAAGAYVTDAVASHGLRTVIARSEGQFVRLYVSTDGQVVVAGLMADLSPADLLTMAPGQVTELGSLHGLRGMFVRNAGQFQVFYATPDNERVIPGAMFDAQGKNLTHDQIASIPGAIPTVVIGNTATQTAQTQLPAGSLLKAVEATIYGATGSPAAPRLWMFVDPLCAWSVRAMGQLRPYVTAGRVQLAVIPVSVLDHEDQGRSTVAAKAMLSLPPDTMVPTWSGNKLSDQAKPAADQRLSTNMAAVAAIGLRGTPTFVWRKADGTEGRMDGLPNDVESFITSVGR